MSNSSPASVLQSLIERAGRLYTLPAVAVEVLELTKAPTVDARLVKECLERDPALVARLLRVVNSSLLGLSRQVSDLGQAIALLGIKPLKLLVLGFSLPRGLTDGVEAATLHGYWRHTLTKAVACRLMSERLLRSPGDDAFVAGLLHDIGQLVLLQDLGEPYIKFLQHVEQQQLDLIEQELDTLGFDHRVLSSRLLTRWGLPATLAAAIGQPLDTATIAALPTERRALPQLLHLAELLAQSLERPGAATLSRLLEVGQRYRVLDFDSLRPIAEALQSQVEQLSAALGLGIEGFPNCGELLRLAHARLADVAADAAVDLLTTDRETQLLSDTVQLQSDLQRAITPTTLSTTAPGVTDAALPTEHAAIAHGDCGLALVSTPPMSDTALLGIVTAAVAQARATRSPVSLAFVQLDAWQEAIFRQGPGPATRMLALLETALAGWTQQRGRCIPLGDGKFALLWENCPRQQALDLARQLRGAIKSWQPLPGEQLGLTLSVGLATLTLAPKNFPSQELLAAARRCLSGVELSGGDGVKSFEF